MVALDKTCLCHRKFLQGIGTTEKKRKERVKGSLKERQRMKKENKCCPVLEKSK